MPLHTVGTLSLLDINIAAAGALTITTPLLAQLDLMLFGSFGLGSTAASLSLSFNASIDASLQLGLGLQNPLQTIQLTLSALAQIESALLSAANISVPTIQISSQISANIATQAAIGAQLAGVQAQIAAALAVKNPAVDFISSLTANLSTGASVVVASWGYAAPPDSLAAIGADIDAAFSSGIGGLLPSDSVYGVLLVTKDVSASSAISATLLVE